MKYCINCGHILPDFANFCPICGQKQFDIPEEELPPVEEPVEEPQPIIEEETPVIEEEPVAEEPVVAEEAPTEEPVQEEVIEEVPIEEGPQPEITEEKPESVKIENQPKPKEVVVEEQPVVVAPAATQEEPEPVTEEEIEAPVVDKPEPEKKKGKFQLNEKGILYALLYKNQIKYSLIIIGATFGVSLLFWIIASFTNVFAFFKVLLMLANLAFTARMGFIMFKEIKENKFENLFNVILLGSISVMQLLLFILSIVFLAV